MIPRLTLCPPYYGDTNDGQILNNFIQVAKHKKSKLAYACLLTTKFSCKTPYLGSFDDLTQRSELQL